MLIFLFTKADENLVPNNSFENHTNISFNHLPDEENQFPHVDRWKVAGETTPDWFSKANFYRLDSKGLPIKMAVSAYKSFFNALIYSLE